MGVHRLATARSAHLESDVMAVEVGTRAGAILSARTRDGRPFMSNASSHPTARPADGIACFSMVPVCNRVEGNRFTFRGRSYELQPNGDDPLYLHGDGWHRDWELVRHDTSEVHLAFDKRAGSGSPLAYRAEQGIRIDGAKLELTLGVTNRGDDPMPFGLGFHPYFPRTPRTTLFAPAIAWRAERDGFLPGERRYVAGPVDFCEPRLLPGQRLNNGFEGWRGTARITWPERKLGVDMTADAHLDRYMIYAPQEARDFFCFEPMSHTPNALAGVEHDPQGLRVLDPGESFEVSMTIRVFGEEQ